MNNKKNFFSKAFPVISIIIILAIITLLIRILIADKVNNNMDIIELTTDNLGKIEIKTLIKEDKLFGYSDVNVKNKDFEIDITGNFQENQVNDSYIHFTNNDFQIIKKGSLKNGKLNGEGSIEQKKGGFSYIKEGVFIDDKLNGYGIKIFKNNNEIVSEVRGIFKDDILSE